MKKWQCKIIVDSLSQEEIQADEYTKGYFRNPENPKDNELKEFFKAQLEYFSESNDGCEVLAKSEPIIEEVW